MSIEVASAFQKMYHDRRSLVEKTMIEMRSLEVAARICGIEIIDPLIVSNISAGRRFGAIKASVISRLEAAGTKGTTAREIQDFITSENATSIHPKTVYVVLNRLRKAGIARRDKGYWFWSAK